MFFDSQSGGNFTRAIRSESCGGVEHTCQPNQSVHPEEHPDAAEQS